MQFHLNGFKPGNLQVDESLRENREQPEIRDLPEQVDVLIVGCGPAGLMLARQLSVFGDINTCIVEQKSGPMLFGQADGVSCRTIEIMEAFNKSEAVTREAYWLNLASFWDADPDNPQNITRTRKVTDARVGLSEFTHVVLNQARIHDFLLEGMLNSAANLKPDYSRTLIGIDIAKEEPGENNDHPVTATLQQTHADGETTIETVESKFIVGCDGARSSVRRLLDIPMRGDSANKCWGVMDALVLTDFPDIRIKTFIQSASEGALVLIPREGGYLVRFYIELGTLGPGQRASDLSVTPEDLIGAAQRVFNPYYFEVKEIAWWSVYEIGQRVSDRFDNLSQDAHTDLVPRAFIAGDACHTHSPKAGLGMNVSMHDAFNLGWKLAAVLRKKCLPSVLHTYSAERQTVAENLISLDRTFAKMVAARPGDAGNDSATDSGIEDVARFLARQNGFIAGTGIQYGPSLITSGASYQYLAGGFTIGERFHSAQVIRIADGMQVHLGHLINADGRWRIFLFAGADHPMAPDSDLFKLVGFLSESEQSPVNRFTPSGSDIDAVIDVYSVFQQHCELSIEELPDFLWPAKGKYRLRDYEKAFVAETGNDIYDQRQINRNDGCMVVVRPDQHVSNVLPLTACEELVRLFDEFMIPQT